MIYPDVLWYICDARMKLLTLNNPSLRRTVSAGRKGGVQRARNLSPPRRNEIARDAARARWGALPIRFRTFFWNFDAVVLPDWKDCVLVNLLGVADNDVRDWLLSHFSIHEIRRWLSGRWGGGLSDVQLSHWVSARTIRAWRAVALAVRPVSTLPVEVRRLLHRSDLETFDWNQRSDRYPVVAMILSRWSAPSLRWLAGELSCSEIRELLVWGAGGGLVEPERERVRREFGLSTVEIPTRPYLGLGF
jgi:hypothetical protein